MNERKPFTSHFEEDTTSGQVGPKSSKKAHAQFRQESAETPSSERLHQGADSSGYASRAEKQSTRRVERTSSKLEHARENLAKQKPPKKPGTIKSVFQTVGHQAGIAVHRKIHENEHENVGVEAAHKTELAGESAIRGSSRFVKTRIRTRPARRVRRLEKRDIKAKADLQYKKLMQEHPELKKNMVSRYLQKQRLKRRYQKQAREAAKKGAQAAKKTAVTTEKIAVSVFRFVRRHPLITVIIILLLVLILLIQSCMGSVMTIGNGLTGAVAATSYLAEDADIDNAELIYTEWETDLQMQINNIEQTRPGYDEYRYDVDDIGHNPYELMAYLTVAYENFTYAQIEGVLRGIFNEQYTLTTNEITETRTETRTISVGDSIGVVRTTGYCNCTICCGQWAGGPTASGVMPKSSHTIAVDARNPIVPRGTKVVINGVTYTVEDTGNLNANNSDIDIYFDSHAEALAWGRRNHTMYLASGNSNTVEVTTTQQYRILEVTLTAQSFSNCVFFRMDAQQLERYNMLMMTKGNRQYLRSPFGETNWLPYVTSYYGYRVHPISGGKDYHKGVDIAFPSGTDILSGQDGTVTFAGENGGYGLVVVIENEKGLVSKYAHCSQLLVSAGQTVQVGDVIAKVGSTGNSTGPHLHLEILMNGQYLNPLYYAVTNDYGAGPVFGNPGIPMGDGSYAALIAEAEKHLGKPYVFGAKGPNKFDCSGFVCWSLTHSGVKNIATNAQGLYNACTPISPSEARPGDLIFFTKTYSTPNAVTHVAIYVGGDTMLHAGKPVQYTSFNTNYWKNHFYGFGRLN